MPTRARNYVSDAAYSASLAVRTAGFDLPPYFDVVKPTLHERFDYRELNWSVDSSNADTPQQITPQPTPITQDV